MGLSFCLPKIEYPIIKNEVNKDFIYDIKIDVIENRTDAP